MATLMLHDIDDPLFEALRERARKEHTNLNTVVLRILKESLGLEKQQ